MSQNWEYWFLALLLAVVFLSFVKEWLPVEIVALAGMFLCVIVGILDLDGPAGALSVFSHGAPLAIGCMFVISAALERTGVIETLGDWFEGLAAKSETSLLVWIIVIVAFLSGFVNNTPVVVVLMPVILGICRRKDWKASRYLIPLSYAAIVGGTITIIGTSTNLIAAGIAEDRGLEPFGMFEVTKLGLIFCLITAAYLLIFGRKLLPDRSTLASLIDTESSREFITHAYVSKGSPLVGKEFGETPFAKIKKLRLIEVRRNGLRVRVPLKEIRFRQSDELFFKGSPDGVLDVTKTEGVEVNSGAEEFGLEGVQTESAVLMEGILGPESSLVGKSLSELKFRQQFGVIILAVHRRGQNLREKFEDTKLAFGDTLLVQGSAEKMRRLFEQRDFVNLSAPTTKEFRKEKARWALVGLGIFVLLGALGGFEVIPKIPTVQLALGAALFVLITGCLTPNEAYDAIDWRILFLIMGMLGIGLAMIQSGLLGSVADLVAETCGGMDPRLLLALIYLLAAILTELVSNQAVAVLLTPLAIQLGVQMEIDPRALVVAVMFGASASFSTPIGYQTNTYVFGAGGYKFGDFFRVGFPLAVILWLTASLLIPLLWGI
ncbi:SLC13 family permease [Roseibacillus ishigakijimensis]|uniref:SLC13 family permease n=1 Tax=Roseibacillus ishigakijimensis TaxID=454146 RepID=A0A934VHR1_9BACT|nr:SLC13 family permease [Roseibacillus ishigakijimensis]MBK1834243.1 SLC13 family permease [Roseibacillus ishigakijimensis]